MKKLKLFWQKLYQTFPWWIVSVSVFAAVVAGGTWTVWQMSQEQSSLVAEVKSQDQLAGELEKLKKEDQVVRNANLTAEISKIEETYTAGAKLFEERADLVTGGAKTQELDLALASFLGLLGKRDYQGAGLEAEEVNRLIASIVVASVPKVAVVAAEASNSLPGSGYSRQKVVTARGEFVISAVIAPGARAVVETAGEADCQDNCPTKSLAEHVAGSGGFAGINGAYFCPPDYARCQGKINSFDTLAVSGRTKAVLNRANNEYSVVPLVAMYGTNLSFYDQTVQWGVDTSSGGALANFPRLLRDKEVATSDDSGKGTRGFIGVKDGAIVIGHVYAASYADTAEVLKTVGLQNAMNLDGGGSSALWFEGSYKTGPGRSLPTAIVLLR